MVETKSDIGLEHIWRKCLKLRAKWNKLRAEVDKLWAEGSKLWTEGNKLYVEGDKLWVKAVLKVKGKTTMEWINRDGHLDCKLETGEIFMDKETE